MSVWSCVCAWCVCVIWVWFICAITNHTYSPTRDMTHTSIIRHHAHVLRMNSCVTNEWVWFICAITNHTYSLTRDMTHTSIIWRHAHVFSMNSYVINDMSFVTLRFILNMQMLLDDAGMRHVSREWVSVITYGTNESDSYDTHTPRVSMISYGMNEWDSFIRDSLVRDMDIEAFVSWLFLLDVRAWCWVMLVWVMSRGNTSRHIWICHVTYEGGMSHMIMSCHVWMRQGR